MPYKQLKAPRLYERMRKHNMSKEKAARLSNWMKKKGYNVSGRIRKTKRKRG